MQICYVYKSVITGKFLKEVFYEYPICACFGIRQYFVCTSNSMGSSEIWDKYHECCIGNGDKFHEAKPSEISIFNATRVVFIPNFIAIPMLFPVNTILAAYTHAVH